MSVTVGDGLFGLPACLSRPGYPQRLGYGVTGVGGAVCRTQRVGLPGAATWTVLGRGHGVVGRAEEFLEYLRVQGTSPNTVKSYARALALWWTYLSVFGLAWDALTLADVGGFLAWLRSGDGPQVVSIEAAVREVRRVDDQHPAAGGDVVLPVPRAERRHARRGPGAGGARRPGRL